MLPQSALSHFKRMWLDGKGWSRGTIFGQGHCETPAVPLPPLSPSALRVTSKEAAAAEGLGECVQQAAPSGLHQLAELPSEGQTCSTHLEIPDKLRFTPSRLLEPTWWLSRCTYIWASALMAQEAFQSLVGAERRHFSPIQLPFPPAHLCWSGSF